VSATGTLRRMPLDASTIVSLIGTLGFGSVIGPWAGVSKDRKTSRAAVLKELANVEQLRWHVDAPKLASAIRGLETAALIGRVPRSAVRPYVQLATAAMWIIQDEVEIDREPRLTGEMDDVVIDAAEIISDAAWSTSATRWIWLRGRIDRLDRKVAKIDDVRIKGRIENARNYVR
jgi:hypothetical protein